MTIYFKAFDVAAAGAGYMGLNDYALSRIAEELKKICTEEAEHNDFVQACLRCGIDPNLIKEEHIEKIKELTK